MIILSGDIGGTRTRLMLTEFNDQNTMSVITKSLYKNSDYTSFFQVLDNFFEDSKINKNQIQAASFGVAGPIINGNVHFTNLPWAIKLAEITKHLGLENVALLNDFTCVGYGLETLADSDLVTLQKGKQREFGVKSFIGAGTGLGVGFMTCNNCDCQVLPTEGGHVDFAPTDDIQVELLKFMRKRYHRVSYERFLSGQGLVNIYQFVRDNRIFGEEENPDLRFLLQSGAEIDIAATIYAFAVEHKDVMSIRALELFIRIYGAAAGNLALTTLPYGGLYIVGGIAPKMIPQIKSNGFIEIFYDKGRMSNLLKDIPVYVVKNTDVGLYGAAMFAKKLIAK